MIIFSLLHRHNFYIHHTLTRFSLIFWYRIIYFTFIWHFLHIVFKSYFGPHRHQLLLLYSLSFLWLNIVYTSILDIQKQRLAVDQSFNKGMEKYTKLEQAHLHQKVDTIKDRANQNEENLQGNKDQGRKIELQK